MRIQFLLCIMLVGCSPIPKKAREVKSADAAMESAASATVPVTPAKPASPVTPCPEELYWAVLEKLNGSLYLNSVSSTIEEVNRCEARIRCVRAWAKSLKDPCIRFQYNDWLDHYAANARDRRVELRKPQDKRTDYYTETVRKMNAGQAYATAHHLPTPETCERDVIREVQ